MNKNERKISTTAGEIKQVSLEDFIAEMPFERAGDVVQQYNACVSYGDGENATVPNGQLPQEEDSTYVRTCVIAGEGSRHQQLLQILSQVDFINVECDYNSYHNLEEFVEKAAVHSLENFGLPTHLVEISHNCYGLFCMEDFKFKMINPALSAIVCYAPRRNIVFRAGW